MSKFSNNFTSAVVHFFVLSILQSKCREGRRSVEVKGVHQRAASFNLR